MATTAKSPATKEKQVTRSKIRVAQFFCRRSKRHLLGRKTFSKSFTKNEESGNVA